MPRNPVPIGIDGLLVCGWPKKTLGRFFKFCTTRPLLCSYRAIPPAHYHKPTRGAGEALHANTTTPRI